MDFSKQHGETEEQYLQRLFMFKQQLGMTWAEIRDIANEELGYSYSQDKYRKDSYKYLNTNFEDILIDPTLDEVRLERTKLADERAQVNALYRRIAREDYFKELAHEAVQHMDAQFKLPATTCKKKDGNKEAILEISDWHYGIEIDNYWNKYNPDIAKERIAKLKDEVIRICEKEGVTKIHVVNLGDLIAGRIHLPLRINSRFDVVTQIMEVSELLAQMLSDLDEFVNVQYYDTLDNHSRLEPNLKESMELESLARITTWYLKERLPWLKIGENVFGDDIISFETLGHKVVGVHGHKDKPTKLIDSLNTYTQVHYDLALSAHLHHFSANESNNTILICNGSMMGTDDFAEKLRLNSKASQNLIIVTKENPVSCIYKINLD